MLRFRGLFFLAVLCVFSGFASLPAAAQDKSELIRNLGFVPVKSRPEAPAFTLKDLDGGSVSLASFKGSYVLLNFWASWCGPCREEMPSLEVLSRRFAEGELRVLAVNVQEDSAVVGDYLAREGLGLGVALDRDGRVAYRYNVGAYPTSFLVDREGRIVGAKLGYHDYSKTGFLAGMAELLGL